MVSFFQLLILFITLSSFVIKCEECPKDFPIYNTLKGNCSLEYCTESQFEEGICIISNSIIKTQWINSITILSTSNDPQTYSNIGIDTNGNILIQSFIDKNRKIYYSIEKDGNSYFKDNSHFYFFNNTENGGFLYNHYYPLGVLSTLNSHRYFYSFSYNESLQIYDLNETIITEYNIDNYFNNKIISRYNSLIKTYQNNIFIYSYISTNNTLALKILELIDNGIAIKYSLVEVNKTIPRNSRNCKIFQLTNNYIECLDMDENQNYLVNIYIYTISNIRFNTKINLEKNKAPINRAFYSYNEIVLLDEDEHMFIYYNDIPENGARPFVVIKKYSYSNKLIINSVSKLANKVELFTKFDYYFSDSDNSITKTSEGYYILATMTLYENKHLMLALINHVPGYSMLINYFDIPFKDLHNINYYGNLYCFNFAVTEKQNDTYINSFILFEYANTTDPDPVKLFSEDNTYNGPYIIRLSDYVTIENNIFGYNFNKIKITSWPNKESGISILLNSTNSTPQISKNEMIIPKDEYIIITVNESDMKRGSYEIIFIPELEEVQDQIFLNYVTQREVYGEDISQQLVPGVTWSAEIYKGRKTKLLISTDTCYKNCFTCYKFSSDESNQQCKECNPGYYFEENTTNCYNELKRGYFFNEKDKVFSKCHGNCETCFNKSEINKQNCLTCKENYLLYNSTNCLNCKHFGLFVDFLQLKCNSFVPVGYYLNNSEYNTIDKCHQNCYVCNKGPEGDNMNCINCDDRQNLYKVENTNNCEYPDYEGYYLTEAYTLRKCHPFCKTCSKGPTEESNNCDSCNNKLGYFFNDTESKNCIFKEKENMYYIQENDSYLPCYENCLYCFDKEKYVSNSNDNGNSYIDMNCLSCNESNNFFLLTKSGNNCLNCKEQNKYVNFEETGCIDELPEGFYISNNVTYQIDKCYPGCKTCSEKEVSSNDMKCDSCFSSQGYFLYKGNCVLNINITCPSFFYYTLNNKDNNKNTDIIYKEEKECLSSKEECPYSLSFYNTNTLECINNCSLDLIFGTGCKIANIEKGLNEILSLINITLYSDKSKSLFEKAFSFMYNNSQIFVFKINIFEFKGKKEEEKIILEENINRIDEEGNLYIGPNLEFVEHEINLEQCLEILEANNIIDNDTKLIMMKVDIKNINLNSSQFIFKLFDNNNKNKKIDLSLCSTINQTIIINIDHLITHKKEEDISEDTNEINTDKINSSNINDHNNNNYNTENYYTKKYSNNKCTVTYNEYDADILVEDRIALEKEYNLIDNTPQNEKTDTVINKETDKKIVLETDIETETTQNSQLNPIIKIPLSEICPPNYHLIYFDFSTNNATCFFSININDLIKDINLNDLLVEKEETHYTYMGKDYIEIGRDFKIDTNNIINTEANLITNSYTDTDTIWDTDINTILDTDINIDSNTNLDINTNSIINTNTNININSNINTISVSSVISSKANIIYMKCINNISKQFKNNYVLIILMILVIGYIACIVIYFFIYRKQYLEEVDNKIHVNKIINLKGSFLSSVYKKDKSPPKQKEIRTYKRNVFSSINSDMQSVSNQLNNNKNNHDIKNKEANIYSDQLTNRQNNYNNYNNHINYNISKIVINNNEEGKKDYDLSNYIIAREKDKRNCWELFLSISKKKQIYLFAFTEDNYIKILKISLLVFSLINYFTTNVFFFTDKVIHQIYLDKGSYNFSYQVKNICLASLISSLFLYLGKYIFIVKRFDKQLKQLIKCIDLSTVFVTALFIFYWLYVGSYTSVFIKSQKHISINFVLTIVTCTIYEIILTIISIILRTIAINNRDKPTLYKISVLLILLKGN